MSKFEGIIRFYEQKYKPLILVSFVLFLLSFIVLGVNYARTGEMIPLSVGLKGGTLLTTPISSDAVVDLSSVERGLRDELGQDVVVRGLSQAGRLRAISVESAEVAVEALVASLENQGIPLTKGEYTVEITGSALGSAFFRQMTRAIILAFIGMALVVFIIFRNPVVSGFMILAAFADAVSALAAASLLGVQLSTAGIAALLMLIGYSVDTDIMLSTRVLKIREGTPFERIKGAFRTGFLITITSLAALTAGYFLTQSDVIKQIMLILLLGLSFDLVYTWLQNAGLLRWWLERKAAQKHQEGGGGV